MSKIGSQGLGEGQTAYQMGLQCPIGQEIQLLLGLEQWWPDLPFRPEAKEEFLRGLADRFNPPNKAINPTPDSGPLEQSSKS
jgi:hypothetical protein